MGGWGGDGNIPWTCIHSQLYAHTHTHTFGLGGVGVPRTCTHTSLRMWWVAHILECGWSVGWVGGVG